jgi:hypothetical protein
MKKKFHLIILSIAFLKLNKINSQEIDKKYGEPFFPDIWSLIKAVNKNIFLPYLKNQYNKIESTFKEKEKEKQNNKKYFYQKPEDYNPFEE